MARRTQLIVISSVVGCIAFLIPLGTSLYAAWAQGRSDADEVLEQLNTNVLRRAAMLRFQTNAAIDLLASRGGEDICSAADLDRMRQTAASSSYLQGIGRVRDTVLQCSTLTDNDPVDLGPADRSYPLAGAPLAWDSVKLAAHEQTKFAVTARAGFAAIYLPELVSDIAIPTGMTVGQFAMQDLKVIRSNGAVDEAWLRRFQGDGVSFEDEQGRLVAVKLSDLGYTAAVAAMSPALVRTYMYKAAGRMLPVGVAVGAALALLVAWRARYLLSMKARLRQALRHKEFHLVYQPVVDLRSNRCVGAEALIRWTPPGEPPVSPAVFIPEAENHGLIQQVTAQVMDMVARDAAALITAYPETHIAINFSAEDLHSPQIGARLKELLSQARAGSHNIMIEATERGLMKPEKAKGTLISVRAQGFKVAIDDFGTGSSSLSYLATYDLDMLKIDKMFVDSFEQESPTTKVAYHIIEIARTLELEMIAEGVETERQRDVLRDAGVQYAQGWFFAKPMPMPDLIGFIRGANSA